MLGGLKEDGGGDAGDGETKRITVLCTRGVRLGTF